MDQEAVWLQYAALPYRKGEGERPEILLISSRETRRWVIPKGWPMKGRTPAGTAAREAFEEAGLRGEISGQPLGSYRYLKRRADGPDRLCEVNVFPLRVDEEAESWPEQAERTRRWFALKEAAAAVDEPELKELILRFSLARQE